MNQHEENKKRDIHVNEKGTETTNEEQMIECRKTIRFEQEVSNTSTSSDPFVTLRHLERYETPSRSGSVLVLRTGHAFTNHICAIPFVHKRGTHRTRLRIAISFLTFEKNMSFDLHMFHFFDCPLTAVYHEHINFSHSPAQSGQHDHPKEHPEHHAHLHVLPVDKQRDQELL